RIDLVIPDCRRWASPESLNPRRDHRFRALRFAQPRNDVIRTQQKIGGAPMAKICAMAIGSILLALAGFPAPAAADDYRSRTIRLIIPFAPGGSNDVVGRIIANQLGQALGKQVFVDNRPGAGGVVGSDLAAKADPDGYTLLIISIAHAVDP